MPDHLHPIETVRCRVAVTWIDWYPYHIARFRGLVAALPGEVAGIELVGGIGVHAGLKFREEIPAELPIHTLLPHASWREASKLRIAGLLWRKLNELDPETVLVPGYYTLPGLACALWARVNGAQSVLMTESCAFDHARTGWKEKLKSFGLRRLFTWAVSGGTAHVAYLHQLGFADDRIAGFYDVVDNDFFRSGTELIRTSGRRPDAGRLPASKYFLYVGRLATEKNVAGLLQSWIDYRVQGGTWPLLLVGDGPEAASLKSVADASGFAAEVVFAGHKSTRETLPYYAFAGMFVLPSKREPWGLVVNEAMACGLPVLVSSRCGCTPDLVSPGRNGFLFNPLDPTAGRTLTRLLLHVEAMPPDQLAEMGRASAEIVRPFSPENFGRSVAAIARQSQGGRSVAGAAVNHARAGGSL